MTSSQANSLNHILHLYLKMKSHKIKKHEISSQAKSLNHLQIQTQNIKSQKIKKA